MSAVRVEGDGRVAVVVIDNPPVNASTAEVRRGLAEALDGASDGSVDGVVIIGAGRNFVAGSDVKEFDGPIAPPTVPTVLELIERCPVPVVAAIRGAALGAGLELALACDARVAAPDASIGLPEVDLGILPGAGGTARLPRIVGVPRALDLIGNTTRLSARDAQALGIVDEVVDGDLRAAAVARALALDGKRRVSERPVAPFDADELAAVEAKVRRRAGDRPHVAAAIAAVRRAAEVPFADAVREERAAFETLRVTEEAAALRNLFFAERHADQVVRRARADARVVERAAVIGAGTMGAGIAWTLAAVGIAVVLVDTDSDVAARGKQRIGATAGRRLASDAVGAVLDRITVASDDDALASADVVIEAVVEDLATKQTVFRRVAAVAHADAVLATNTSYLDVDAIAAVTDRAADVVGMHFFAPAHVMRLLEVVRARESSDCAVATALVLGDRLGKLAVVARVGDGFIGNRVFNAYRGQCDLMIEEGAYPEEVDAAMRGFGFAMGPYAVADMSGLDIAWRNRQRLATTRDPRERHPLAADWLCEAGRLGQKTGAGWYRYEDGRTPIIDPEVHTLVDAASAASGVERRPFDSSEIVERALGAMVNEAALLLDEGVAASADDVDLVLVHGYGFPRHRGGPMFWARQHEAAHLARALDRLGAATGFGFRAADLGTVLAPAED